jgi:hypothetical protein
MGISTTAHNSSDASSNLLFLTETLRPLDVGVRARIFQIIFKISTLRARR